jgi:hypothetical protein
VGARDDGACGQICARVSVCVWGGRAGHAAVLNPLTSVGQSQSMKVITVPTVGKKNSSTDSGRRFHQFSQKPMKRTEGLLSFL